MHSKLSYKYLRIKIRYIRIKKAFVDNKRNKNHN